MTRIEREKIEVLAREAKVIRDVWLREREEARAVQISVMLKSGEVGESLTTKWG